MLLQDITNHNQEHIYFPTHIYFWLVLQVPSPFQTIACPRPELTSWAFRGLANWPSADAVMLRPGIGNQDLYQQFISAAEIVFLRS